MTGNLSNVPYDIPKETMAIESELIEIEDRELKKFQEEWNLI